MPFTGKQWTRRRRKTPAAHTSKTPPSAEEGGQKLHPYKMEETNCDTIVQTLVWRETKEQTHADTYRNDIKSAKERESPTPNILSNEEQYGEVCVLNKRYRLDTSRFIC